MTEHHWQDDGGDTCPTCGRPWRKPPAPAHRGPGSTPAARQAALTEINRTLADTRRRRQEQRP